MPPCKTVFLKKIARTNYLTQLIKCSSKNHISAPKNGWVMNERNELELDYFVGDCYPTNIMDVANDQNLSDIEEKEEEEPDLSSEDEEEFYDEFDDNE